MQFPTQVELLKTTWKKKAMRNCMPEDSELLSTVLDDSLPVVNFFEIVSKLVNSLVPTKGNSYGMELANDFEAVIRRAIKKGSAPKPRSLNNFIEKGFVEKEPRNFEIVQTSEYHEANVIFTEMEELELLNDTTSDTKVNFDFTSAKRSIELTGEFMKAVIMKVITNRTLKCLTILFSCFTGRNSSDHLIRACISDMIANRNDTDFRMFHTLFDYYYDHQLIDLQRQLQEIDQDNGMCCLHYLAILGDEPLIKKALEINPDFAKDLRDAESKSPLDYMKNRPDLKHFVLELDPPPVFVPPIPAPKPTTPEAPEENVKDDIISYALRPSQIKLADTKKQIAELPKKSSTRRRNGNALEGITDHLSFMDGLIERIDTQYYIDNKMRLEDVERELNKKRKYTEERVSHFGYHKKWSSKYDNEYALYEHERVLKYYDTCLERVATLKKSWL